MTKTCTVLVGLPASGKSTRVSAIQAMDKDAYVYSTDAIIEDWSKSQGWSYDMGFSKYIKNATTQANEWLATAIENGQNIVWDQTNLTDKKRKKIIERMKQNGYQVNCECFEPPQSGDEIAEMDWRLNNREGKTIPDNIIISMVNSYVRPTLDEGFDELSFFDIYGNHLK